MLMKLNSWLIRWFTPGNLTKDQIKEYETRLKDIQQSKEKFISTYIYNLEHPEFRKRYSRELSR